MRRRAPSLIAFALLVSGPAACGPGGAGGSEDAGGASGSTDPGRSSGPAGTAASVAAVRFAPPPIAGGAGRLVIIGGALSPDNEAVYRAVLDGSSGDGPICVVPTASGEPQRSMATAVDRIDRWGGEGTAEGVLITVGPPEEAEDPAVAERMRRCAGFYFTGGSQSRIVRAFRPDGRSTPAYEALMARWREGAVVAGSSAGAAMMGGRIIAGGSSADAFMAGVGTDPQGVEVSDGLGLFAHGWLDQHFLARGRWGRLLMTTVLAAPYDVGFGIDENTALVVDGDRGVVVGASGVVIIDARAAEVSTPDGAPPSDAAAAAPDGAAPAAAAPVPAAGLRLHLAGAGSEVTLSTLRVQPPAGAVSVASDAAGVTDLPDDPFARWGLLHALHAVAGQPSALDYVAAGAWRIGLAPAEDFSAWRDPADRVVEPVDDAELESEGDEVELPGLVGIPPGLSVGPLEVTVEVAGG